MPKVHLRCTSRAKTAGSRGGWYVDFRLVAPAIALQLSVVERSGLIQVE